MKLLLVEDEKKLAESIARGLKNFGHTADMIHDGKEAMERIRFHSDEYDLIVLDLQLPNIEGHVICRRAREYGVNIPILILTANNSVNSKIELLRRGADDYLSKPFSLEELAARIEALLRRPREVLPEILTVDELELNVAERSVRKDGELLNLTLKEFSLLEYFMRNKGQVISRDELLSHVWDFNYTSFFSNSVDVHIKNLRRKIENPNRAPLLETVRGIGYKLAPREDKAMSDMGSKKSRVRSQTKKEARV